MQNCPFPAEGVLCNMIPSRWRIPGGLPADNGSFTIRHRHDLTNKTKTMKAIHKQLILAAVLAAFTTQGWAETMLFAEPTGDMRTDGGLVAGLAFNANTGGTAQINEVGYWDPGGSGLARDHVVGLFQRLTIDHPYYWKLLAKAKVPAGTTAPLRGGYRWVSLPTTVTLTDTSADGDYGRYAVLAEVGSDAWGNRGDGVKPAFDTSIAASIATYSSFWGGTIGTVGSSQPFIGNGNVFAGANAGYVAPTGAPTTTTLARTAGTEPSNFVGGLALTYTATVAGSSPTGDVEFFDGTPSLGTQPLTDVGGGHYQASLTTSTLAIGSHSITATYLGDGVNNAPSTSDPLPQTITDNRATTTTTLALTAGTNPSDQITSPSVTFTATVVGSAATGNVEFNDGATLLGTAALNGSFQAILTTSSLIVGTHNIIATYLGDGVSKSSSSEPLSHTVTGPTTLFGTPSGSTRSDYFAAAGMDFNAAASGTAQINEVGFWDQDGDGLAQAHTVGIFQRDPANPNYFWKLIAKATVPAGTTAPLQGGYRWVSLGQTLTLANTLPAGADANFGQYAIFADGGSDPMGGAAADDAVPLVDGGAIASSIPGNRACYWAVGWPFAENVSISTLAVGASQACSGFGFVWWGPNARYVAPGAPPSAYATWASNKGLTGTTGSSTDPAFNADPNKDGVANGLVWLLGGTTANPLANSHSILPVPTADGGKWVMTFQALNSTARETAHLYLEFSKDLGQADLWRAHQVAVPDSDLTDVASGVEFIVTPTVPASNYNQVTVKIPLSAAAVDGKLFGRLKATES